MNAEATRSLILAILHKHQFSVETKGEVWKSHHTSGLTGRMAGPSYTTITPQNEEALREDIASFPQDVAFAILLYDFEREPNQTIRQLTVYLKQRLIDNIDDIRLLSSLSIVTDSQLVRQYVLDRMKYLSQHIPQLESLESL